MRLTDSTIFFKEKLKNNLIKLPNQIIKANLSEGNIEVELVDAVANSNFKLVIAVVLGVAYFRSEYKAPFLSPLFIIHIYLIYTKG